MDALFTTLMICAAIICIAGFALVVAAGWWCMAALAKVFYGN